MENPVKVFATEQQFQSACVMWFNQNYTSKRKLLHCNNNNSHDKRSGNVAKALGVVPGVSDLELICDGMVVFIELKIGKGTHSPDQKEFQALLEERGHVYVVIRTMEDFKSLVNAYMK